MTDSVAQDIWTGYGCFQCIYIACAIASITAGAWTVETTYYCIYHVLWCYIVASNTLYVILYIISDSWGSWKISLTERRDYYSYLFIAFVIFVTVVAGNSGEVLKNLVIQYERGKCLTFSFSIWGNWLKTIPLFNIHRLSGYDRITIMGAKKPCFVGLIGRRHMLGLGGVVIGTALWRGLAIRVILWRVSIRKGLMGVCIYHRGRWGGWWFVAASSLYSKASPWGFPPQQ